MRNATAQMAARGLGASSLAGQAIVQATMESALPIAQADAAIVAQFEAAELVQSSATCYAGCATTRCIYGAWSLLKSSKLVYRTLPRLVM